MRFRIRSYSRESGDCPVRQFLADIEQKDANLYRFVVVGIDKLRDSKYHGEPLTKSITGSRLLEFRLDDVRILFKFRPERLIVLLNGVRKKTMKLPKTAIDQAEEFWEDYLRRYIGDEEGVDERF